MRPRVIHLASGREWRGGERQVFLLARALQRLGQVDQLVVTRAGSELERRLVASGVSTRPVPWQTAYDPRPLLLLIRLVRSGRFIIHAHDAHATSLACLARLGTDTRLVATRRTNFPLGRGGAWARADAVIAVSQAVKDTLVRGGLAPARIQVIYSGVALADLSAPPSSRLRADLGLPPTATVVLSVGALTPEKGHAEMLLALGRMRDSRPDLHWVVAGEGRGRPVLERAAGEMGLGKRIHLLGQVADAATIMREADLLVSSSLEEGLGTAVLEAMAQRVAIVATRVGGTVELLSGGEGLLVPPGDPVALAEGIERMLADPALRNRAIEAAHLAVQRFTDSGMADRVLSVYRSLNPAN